MQRRWIVVGVVVVIGLLVASFWLGQHVRSVTSVSRPSATPAVLTGTVERSLLTSTYTVDGVVAESHTLRVTLMSPTVQGGSAIVTAPGPTKGTTIDRGAIVAQVGEEPTFAFVGTAPMFRSIAPGDEGEDVLELQENLRALGYPISDAPGVYGTSTQAAFRAFCLHALAKAAPVDQSVCPGPASSYTIPESYVVFVPHLPATVTSDSEVIGSTLASPALTLGWGKERIEGSLPFGEEGFLEVGSTVTLTTATASVTTQGAGTVTSEHQGSGANAGLDFVVTPSQDLTGLAPGASVVITATTQALRHPAIVVPIAAVYTGPSGKAEVTVVEGQRRYPVSFTPGVSLAGRVQVTRPSRPLRSGERVILY